MCPRLPRQWPSVIQCPDTTRKDTTMYYVCETCSHYWSEPEPPSRCENCNHSYLSEWTDIDSAEDASAAVLLLQQHMPAGYTETPLFRTGASL